MSHHSIKRVARIAIKRIKELHALSKVSDGYSFKTIRLLEKLVNLRSTPYPGTITNEQISRGANK